MRLVLLFVAITVSCGFAVAQDKLVYVKKETREATREASLTASGAATWTAGWHIVGPFDAQDLKTPHPPERSVDLKATYESGGKSLAWKEVNLPDGQVHDLKKIVPAPRPSTCYLYRTIESPRADKVRVGLGSDDGVTVFLNGKQVFTNDAFRPAGPDQDLTTLELAQGTNTLLLKINDHGGDWAMYFRPLASAKLQAQLERYLDRDFPGTGEAASYRITTIPLPEGELLEGGGLAFRPDGKLYLATRRGDIWLVENPLSDDPEEVRFKLYARGLHEILGLTLVGENDLYLVQRPEITLVRDLDGDDAADEFTTISDRFGLSGDYHEYIFGPARDDAGNLFVSLNVGFGGGHQSKVPFRGFCLKVSPDGKTTPWAYGLRSPNGINFSPEGKLFYCDNQGEWVASCKMHEIRRDEFYGHMASVRWWEGKKDGDRPKMTPPCLWFPYAMSKSVTEPVWDTTGGRFGPFTGQVVVGDLTNSLLKRASLEEVKGRMQGACFLLRTGFQSGVNRLQFASDGSLFVAQTNRGWGSVGGQPHGLQRVQYTGHVPFEIHSMQVTSDGWKLRFTQPVEKSLAEAPQRWFVDSYTYHHWGNYGSPEIEPLKHDIGSLRLSDDGLTLELAVGERPLGKVYHVQARGLKSQAGADLLHADAYYTLNAVP